MSGRRWLPVFLILACLPTPQAGAQLLSDPSSLRHTFQVQVRWADSLASAGGELAQELTTVAESLRVLKPYPGVGQRELLLQAQELSDRLTSTAVELSTATTMARETGDRLVGALNDRRTTLLRNARNAAPVDREEAQAEAQGLETETGEIRDEMARLSGVDSLGLPGESLRTLAQFVAEAHRNLLDLEALRTELGLFMGGLRLFDETNMAPSARAAEQGGQDPGCGPSACSLAGAAPADMPLSHSQPADPGQAQASAALTPASLARLYHQIGSWVHIPDPPSMTSTQATPPLIREWFLGAGGMTFQEGSRSGSSILGPRIGASMGFSRTLSENLTFQLEPSAGGRALRGESETFSEVAAEIRETLTGRAWRGRSAWQVTAWQKGRFLSQSLPAPGYLEPGRGEAGLAGRMVVALATPWELAMDGGADGVRYEPRGWRVLDRQGLNAGLGLAWRGGSRAASLSLRGGHHAFPNPPMAGEGRRRDTRLGVELGGALEGRQILRLSLGASWNDSRLPAYDFRSVRAALSLSMPLGRGSLQGYGALAHQEYLNPGPEDARIAPSDQDSGSVVSLRYTLPLDGARLLHFQGGWSRSQTGFRNDFYERFGLSLHLAFRGG